jgi:formate-dependent nitrite reductase membrane component NrfD
MHGIGASLSGFGAAIDETRAKRGAIVFALGVLAIGAIAIPWLTALLARRPSKVAAIALANKMARMVWVLMARGERYKEPIALAA